MCIAMKKEKFDFGPKIGPYGKVVVGDTKNTLPNHKNATVNHQLVVCVLQRKVKNSVLGLKLALMGKLWRRIASGRQCLRGYRHR